MEYRIYKIFFKINFCILASGDMCAVVCARGTSKSCQRHFGTTSNTSALNQSIVGRPDSVQVDSPLRQRAHAYVTMEGPLMGA